MIRALFAFALLAVSAPTLAQTPSPDPAIRALAAIWRPVAADETPDAETVRVACDGATEEMVAIEAALPETITPEALSGIRASRGLLIVPAQESGRAYFFPGPSTPWFASGLGAVAVLSEAEGMVGVRDAAGRDIALQIGAVGGRPVLRVRGPDRSVQSFVGCARVPQ